MPIDFRKGFHVGYQMEIDTSARYGGNSTVDSHHSFSGALSSTYAPACDYVVTIPAASSLATPNFPRMVNTPPIGASNTDVESRSLPGQDPATKPNYSRFEWDTCLPQPTDAEISTIPYADPTIQRSLRTHALSFPRSHPPSPHAHEVQGFPHLDSGGQR